MIRIGPVIHVVALLTIIVAAFMLFPLGIAVSGGDGLSARAFGISIVIAIVVAGAAWFATKPRGAIKLTLRSREGFLLVTLSWLIVSAFGALPFVLSRAIPAYHDAYFETMSGFTTTGASILTAIEPLPRSVLFWRSLTHWLGGMGIVVLTVAFLPFLGIGGISLVRAEAPGPTLDKIAPKITETAKILWFIYVGLTVLETALLMIGGMTLFDALTHTFGTLATGGFSPKNASVGHYNSGFIDAVITVFMVAAGLNFGLYHKILTGRIREVFRNTEFKAYLLIFLSAAVLVSIPLIRQYGGFAGAFRFGSFQAASIITTTGYATADFDAWPTASKGILFLLMFVGGCSGSTGGGPKVIRIVTLLKLAINEMKYLGRPRGIFRIRINRQPVKKDFVYAIAGFAFLYVSALLTVTIIVAAFGNDLITSFSSALVTVGNIGPGFGSIGPTLNYAFFPPFVKWVLSLAMLVGRLEVYTVIILLTPAFWSRR